MKKFKFNKKKLYTTIVSCVVVFCAGFMCSVMAEDNSGWLTDRVRLEKLINSEELTDKQRCQATWDILWPYAKNGNLEARVGLIFDMYAHFREFPGRSDDAISRIRDLTIMSVHSVGASGKEDEELVDISYQGIRQLEDISGGEYFLKCVTDNRSQDCARIAVEEKLVPSFEDFAAEIDLFLEQGKKSVCIYGAAY